MKRFWKTSICVGMIALAMSVPTFAGEWQQNEYGWWYKQDDGTYVSNGWFWLDGNNDGTAECYYFNESGYCVTGTTIDGYTTDGNGAWTINGIVQTQSVAIDVNSDVILGSYSGSYNASQGKTGVDLIFFVENDELKAEFIFYNLPNQTNAKNGSYLCNVKKIDGDTYELTPDRWLEQPSGYILLGWQVKLDNKQLTGTSTNNSSYKISVKKGKTKKGN